MGALQSITCGQLPHAARRIESGRRLEITFLQASRLGDGPHARGVIFEFHGRSSGANHFRTWQAGRAALLARVAHSGVRCARSARGGSWPRGNPQGTAGPRARRHQGGACLRREEGRPSFDRRRVTVWLDNHLSPSLARWIETTFGAPCRQVRELGMARASDRAIFEAARGAAHVYITKDRDFAELAGRLGPPPGVIFSPWAIRRRGTD